MGVLTHRPRRLALHQLVLAVARHAPVVEFAGSLVGGLDPSDRVGHIAALYTFATGFADGSGGGGSAFEGLARRLDDVVGPDRASAVILCALLQAAGHRAEVDYTREMAFVRVEVEAGDLARLPPHARLLLLRCRRRLYLPLDPRRSRVPLGRLPAVAWEALSRRRGLRAVSSGDEALATLPTVAALSQ